MCVVLGVAPCQEYEYLLVSQLETQQDWYESKLAAAREEAAAARAEAEAAKARAAEAGRAQAAETRRGTARGKEADKVRKENEFLRELNRTMLRDQQRHREELEASKAEAERARAEGRERIAELEAQVRDLMVYLDTQRSVEQSGMRDEIRVRAGARGNEARGWGDASPRAHARSPGRWSSGRGRAVAAAAGGGSADAAQARRARRKREQIWNHLGSRTFSHRSSPPRVAKELDKIDGLKLRRSRRALFASRKHSTNNG